MKSSICVKRQSFEVRLNSVISFVFVAFCQPRILRYSARDVNYIFAIGVPGRALQPIEGKNAVVYTSKYQLMSSSDANMAARPVNCSGDGDANKWTR